MQLCPYKKLKIPRRKYKKEKDKQLYTNLNPKLKTTNSINNRCELRCCSERTSISCSTSDTRRVTLDKPGNQSGMSKEGACDNA